MQFLIILKICDFWKASHNPSFCVLWLPRGSRPLQQTSEGKLDRVGWVFSQVWSATSLLEATKSYILDLSGMSSMKPCQLVQPFKC